MKNVVKKLFSLLLVGVVAISMFSFVAPPPAEAVEETPSKGTIIFKFISLIDGRCSADYAVDFYGDDDYYISSQPIHFHLATFGKKKTVRYNIPAEAKIVVIKDFWSGQAWGRFKLEESSEFSSGCISAVVKRSGGFIMHRERWSKSSESSGCWKQIQV